MTPIKMIDFKLVWTVTWIVISNTAVRKKQCVRVAHRDVMYDLGHSAWELFWSSLRRPNNIEIYIYIYTYIIYTTLSLLFNINYHCINTQTRVPLPQQELLSFQMFQTRCPHVAHAWVFRCLWDDKKNNLYNNILWMKRELQHYSSYRM